MERHNHYQLDSKLSSKYLNVYYPHPLTIEIEKKKYQQKIPNDRSILSSPSCFTCIIGKLTDWLADHHEKI